MNQLCNATGNPPRKCSAQSGGKEYVNRQRTRPNISRRRGYGRIGCRHNGEPENLFRRPRPANRDDPMGGKSFHAIRLRDRRPHASHLRSLCTDQNTITDSILRGNSRTTPKNRQKILTKYSCRLKPSRVKNNHREVQPVAHHHKQHE